MSIYRISFSGVNMQFEQFAYMVRIEISNEVSAEYRQYNAMVEAYRRLNRNFDVARVDDVQVVAE